MTLYTISSVYNWTIQFSAFISTFPFIKLRCPNSQCQPLRTVRYCAVFAIQFHTVPCRNKAEQSRLGLTNARTALVYIIHAVEPLPASLTRTMVTLSRQLTLAIIFTWVRLTFRHIAKFSWIVFCHRGLFLCDAVDQVLKTMIETMTHWTNYAMVMTNKGRSIEFK